MEEVEGEKEDKLERGKRKGKKKMYKKNIKVLCSEMEK